MQKYQGHCDVQIAKCARGNKSVSEWIQLWDKSLLYNQQRHEAYKCRCKYKTNNNMF